MPSRMERIACFAVLDQIEQGGHTLPGGYTVELLRKASLAWLLPRELEYGAFGEEFSDFTTRPTEAWGSHPTGSLSW